MHNEPAHTWIMAPYLQDRHYTLTSLEPAEGVSYHVDCHRTLRGPYTGTGALLRKIVPEVQRQWPDHVVAHATEIVSVAPELHSIVGASHETLTSLAVPHERTRFYSRLRTLRLTHGLIDFLLGYVSRANLECCCLVFENVHAADTLDQEFLAVLLRRAAHRGIYVIINSSSESLSDPLRSALTTYACLIQPQPLTLDEREQLLSTWNIPEKWGRWLLECTHGWRGEWEPISQLEDVLAEAPAENLSLEQGFQAVVKHCPPTTLHALAQSYVESECTSDNLLERAAYDLSDPVVRQQLHDARAESLEKLNEWSLHLGVIPFHREHGQDPSGSGAQALQAALDYCIDMGYYEATIDLGQRGRKVINWETQDSLYWIFTTKMTTSLAALGHPAEAEALYNEARALTSNALIHMQAAYATAMLYTRHHEQDHRDHQIAKGWIQEAIAIAQLLPDAKQSSFNTVFNQNGLALIEAHLGHPHEALRLVSEGLERLNRELKPDEHLLHRSVLLYNRAQVYAGLGQMEQALADYTAVITQDPHYSEYYFDRGNIYRRLGRNEEALQDYNQAIAFSPPYVEAYYNRAGVLSLLGHEDEAMSDYSYVLELDPTYIDALVNRASLLYEREEYAASRQDVEHGLALQPDNPQLLCTFGLLEMAEQHLDEAYLALTSALERDPSLLAAWTNRAIVAYERGDVDAAIDDLSHALQLDENASVLYNRGLAYQSQARWQEAVSDYTQALSLADADVQELLYQRGVCYVQLGKHALAHQDFEAHVALGTSLYIDDIHRLDPSLITDTVS